MKTSRLESSSRRTLADKMSQSMAQVAYDQGVNHHFPRIDAGLTSITHMLHYATKGFHGNSAVRKESERLNSAIHTLLHEIDQLYLDIDASKAKR